MFCFKKITIITVLFILTLFGFAHATTGQSEEIKKHATQLMNQGEYAQACSLLKGVDIDEYDPQLTFLIAQCDFALQKYALAVQNYKLMLEKNTNLPRVRLDLARTLLVMGKWSEAKQHFEKMLTNKLPPQVRQNIELQLTRIDERKKWGGVVSVGYMYDSNINAAPSDPSIRAFGLPFELDADSTKKEDSAFVGSFSLGRNFAMPLIGDDWRVDFYGNALNYFSEQEYNNHSLGFSVGPNFYGRNQWSFPVSFSASWEDGEAASQIVSFDPSVGIPFGQKFRLNTQLNIQTINDLRDSDEADGWSIGGRITAQYNLTRGQMLEFGVGVTDNDANDLDYNKSLSTAIRLGWYQQFSNGLNVSLQPSVSFVEYDDIDPVDLDIKRKDKRYGVNINIHRDMDLWSHSFTPILSYTYTKNDSNIARREYERNQLMLTIQKRF